MKSFTVWGDEIKETEMYETCSSHGGKLRNAYKIMV